MRLQTSASLKLNMTRETQRCGTVELSNSERGAAGDCGIVQDEVAQWTENVFSPRNT